MSGASRQGLNYRPLAHALIRRIALLSAGCVLLFCVVQAALTYVQERDAANEAIAGLVEIAGPMLSLAVWDIEPEAVQKQLDVLAGNPLLAYVRLDVVTGHQFQAGDAAALKGGGGQSHRLLSPRSGEVIAQLWVVPDPGYLLTRVIRGVLLLLFSASLLALLVCLLVAYVLRKNLELPLRRLAVFAANLRPDSLLSELPQARVKMSGRDEIDLLADGFSTLQQGLARHVETLDERVAQRTGQLESALEDIRLLLERDVLTGCYNKAYLGKTLPVVMSRAAASGQPLSLLFCDLDNFKPVNDRLGHLAGDEVLRVAAARIMSQLDGDQAWAVRFGGEEFVVVLPGCDLAAACEVAERIRQALETTIRLDADRQLRISGSLGVVQALPGEDIASLIRRADVCMYKAKTTGRNQVVCT